MLERRSNSLRRVNRADLPQVVVREATAVTSGTSRGLIEIKISRGVGATSRL
jgi:hypothetical protein